MYKQVISFFLFVALSAVVVLFIPQAKQVLEFLLAAHDWVSKMLGEVFNGGNVGNVIHNLVALLAVPLIVGLFPAIFFWLIRKSWLSCFMQIVWVVWLLQVGALIMTTSVAA